MTRPDESSCRTLQGRRALVTGAGSRVGKAIALGLAAQGADIIIHYFSSVSGAEDTAAQARECGVRATVIQADLHDMAQVKQLAAGALAAFGGLEILVNSASTYPNSRQVNAEHDFARETLAGWEDAFTVNAQAPFFLTQHLAPTLETSGRGAIVNILDSSISRPFLSRAAYSVSKGALASVTKFTAAALAGKVRVNAIELGAILPPEGMAPEFVATRRWSGTDVVVSGVVFLVTNEFVTGETLRMLGEELIQKF